MDKDNKGFFHCEGDDCDIKSKKIKHLVYFKGRYLCHYCKAKASKCLVLVPKANPSWDYIKSKIKLPEGRNMPKEHYKDYTKVSPQLKEWAMKSKAEGVKHISWVGLTKDEHKLLWTHFAKMGLSDDKIDMEIDKIKQQIHTTHKQFSDIMKEIKPNFKEGFEELITK